MEKCVFNIKLFRTQEWNQQPNKIKKHKQIYYTPWVLGQCIFISEFNWTYMDYPPTKAQRIRIYFETQRRGNFQNKNNIFQHDNHSHST